MTSTTRAKHGEARDLLLATLTVETDECIEWPFGRKNGYGLIGWCGETRNVHAVACQLAHGPAPTSDHMALHAPGICHNRACFNPRHLRWGTHAENVADRTLDDMNPRGERCGMAKLTEAQVIEIRRRHVAGGVLQRELAAEFGVHYMQIGRILSGKRWGWLT